MILKGIEKFISEKLSQLQALNIDVSGLELDHFGYQADSAADYEKLKAESDNLGIPRGESLVNGRRVCHFELNPHIKYQNYELSAFEIIEPKPGQKAKSRLDHIEFVLKEHFSGFLERHSGINWDLSAVNRTEFPKLTYKFPDGTSVKFHQENILEEI
jgi:predicted metalloenzyme YecM